MLRLAPLTSVRLAFLGFARFRFDFIGWHVASRISRPASWPPARRRGAEAARTTQGLRSQRRPALLHGQETRRALRKAGHLAHPRVLRTACDALARLACSADMSTLMLESNVEKAFASSVHSDISGSQPSGARSPDVDSGEVLGEAVLAEAPTPSPRSQTNQSWHPGECIL